MSKLEELAEAIAFAHEAETTAETQSPEALALERVAALAAAALSGSATPPSSLGSKLASDALAFCAEARQANVDDEPPGFTTPRPRSAAPILAFVLGAAAASLLLWLTVLSPYERTFAELRAEALAQRVAIQQQLQAGPQARPDEVTGDVVWRQDQQDGWLTFRNLPELPDDKAYQLWIVDGTREGAPVDGGVFQLAANGEETIVPIRARLPIGKPAAFVITVEDRRGVVVSDQKNVVAIASL
ncbi:MAG: anti-sigma factor [Planctomycetes bacterium]|nr:anti-sigma factor [Planctomycetota bacterium]